MDMIKSQYIRSLDNRRELTDGVDIPQVSTDGEPHEILTMIAVSSGCIVAIIVLVILIILIDCKMKRNIKNSQERRISIFTIFGKNRKSVDFTTNIPLPSPPSNNFPKQQSIIIQDPKKTFPETILINPMTEISTIAC